MAERKKRYYHRDQGVPATDANGVPIPPLTVEVWEEPERNERASAGGAAAFDRVVYMEVTPAGQKSGVIYSPRRILPDGAEKLDQQVIRRFDGVWKAWLTGHTPAESGMPLEEWPLMNVSLVESLKYANVHTVQQLAGVPDVHLDQLKIPDVHKWRAKAKAWLDAAARGGNDTEARARIAELERIVKDQTALIAQMQRKENNLGFTKKRGRPEKLADAEDEADVAAAVDSDADAVEEDLRL